MFALRWSLSVFQPQTNAVIHTTSPHAVGQNGFSTFTYMVFRCPGCAHGALGIIHSHGNLGEAPPRTILDGFYPFATEAAPLPKDVPSDIQSEFREAELCAAAGAYGSSSKRTWPHSKHLLKRPYKSFKKRKTAASRHNEQHTDGRARAVCFRSRWHPDGRGPLLGETFRIGHAERYRGDWSFFFCLCPIKSDARRGVGQ